MRKFYLLSALVLLFGCQQGEGRSGKSDLHRNWHYVVAVDSSTASDPAWTKVVDTLVAKYKAKTLTYADVSKINDLLPELKSISPRYVCFVSKPEMAGRELIVEAAQLLRHIDDDPYGDAIWGVVTGYDANDALRMVSNAAPKTVKSIASSMGNPNMLDSWESGFASDEGNRHQLWSKKINGTVQFEKTLEPDSVEALAKCFNEIPVDYFVTSGHATEHDWQVIYNQRAGSLLHRDGKLFFRSSQNADYPISCDNPKVYIAAGNCLIGHIDRPDCMATSWMHTGGVAQMIGYTVPTFYGYCGWGAKSLFESGRHSASEAFFISTQMLLWELGKRNAKLLDIAINPKEDLNVRKFIQKHGEIIKSNDELGLVWDRDTVAFYGDPAWRVTYPEEKLDIAASVNGKTIIVNFKRDMQFQKSIDVKAARSISVLFDDPPPPNAKLYNADGAEIPEAVVTELFAIIPLEGTYKTGDKLLFTLK